MRLHLGAFTLIELSIVLVILGLLIGGVLSGKALIRSASIRSQLSQIHETVTGARTFRDKYLNYPGDLPSTNFAALPGGGARRCWDGQGAGNGDGLIEMIFSNVQGESSLFWNDLTTAKMIAGNYTFIFRSNGCSPGNNMAPVTGSAIGTYLPPAKLGGNLYLYAWSNGVTPQIWTGTGSDGKNYITIAGVSQVHGYGVGGAFRSSPTMRVYDAYSMDMKMDDGMPQTGGVLASYVYDGRGTWAGQAGAFGSNHLPNTTATAGSATTCYDNDGVGGTKHHYSIGQNGGEGRNCSLSFKF